VANASLDWVEIVPMALSSANGTSTFFVGSESAFSGLKDTGRSAVRERRLVELETIDRIWDTRGRRPVDALKIDVEGHEATVLAGGLAMIAGSPDLVIQMEASTKNLADGQDGQLRTMLDRLRQLGFDGVMIDAGRQIQPIAVDGLLNALVGRSDGNLFLTRAGSDREGRLREALTSRQAERRRRSDASNETSVALDTVLSACAAELDQLAGSRRDMQQLCTDLTNRLIAADKAKQEVEEHCAMLLERFSSSEKAKQEVEARYAELLDRFNASERAKQEVEARYAELLDRFNASENAKQEVEANSTRLGDRLAAAERAKHEIEELYRTRLVPAEEHCRELERQIAGSFRERLKHLLGRFPRQSKPKPGES
jgi:hypothetical protein